MKLVETTGNLKLSRRDMFALEALKILLPEVKDKPRFGKQLRTYDSAARDAAYTADALIRALG